MGGLGGGTCIEFSSELSESHSDGGGLAGGVVMEGSLASCSKLARSVAASCGSFGGS